MEVQSRGARRWRNFVNLVCLLTFLAMFAVAGIVLVEALAR